MIDRDKKISINRDKGKGKDKVIEINKDRDKKGMVKSNK